MLRFVATLRLTLPELAMGFKTASEGYMSKDLKQIGVIGAGDCSPKMVSLAEDVGRRIALKGAALITGGLGGVMEAASRGAKSAGGLTIGILPGCSRREANDYVDIAIVTGLSHARNVLVVRSSDIVISIAGGFGTLSEIAFALKMGKPVVGLKTWDKIPGVFQAEGAEEAVAQAFAYLGWKSC
jgi:hypothetical protein